jgi:outer membrane lipoprotein-sorting protein
MEKGILMSPSLGSGFRRGFLFAICWGFLASLPAAETGAQEPERPRLGAQQILQRMANRYATCKSYRDSGVVNSVDIKSTGRNVHERRFTTAFSRPDRLRFEDQDQLRHYGLYRYIIWANGDDVRTYWDSTPPAQQQPSLEMAVAGAFAVTEMTTYFVPGLLMPDRLNSLADALEKAERLEDAKADEHDCFCVGGRFAKYSMALWIDKETYLLRQIQRNADLTSFRTETTIAYSPAMDVELGAKELEFDPPATRSVPSVAEMLGQAGRADGQVSPREVGWVWLGLAVAFGAFLLLIFVIAIRWTAMARGQREK